VNYLIADGKSNYLEGGLLMGVYIVFHPASISKVDRCRCSLVLSDPWNGRLVNTVNMRGCMSRDTKAQNRYRAYRGHCHVNLQGEREAAENSETKEARGCNAGCTMYTGFPSNEYDCTTLINLI
jgi:hypothetical protein